MDGHGRPWRVPIDAGGTRRSVAGATSSAARCEVLSAGWRGGPGTSLHQFRRGVPMTTTVAESIDVDVPVRTAYDQWTQFESFPHFMSGVESIRQVDDTHTHWQVNIGG